MVSFPQVSPPKPCMRLSPIRATCPAQLILDFITRTKLGEDYRSLSSSLRTFLHFPVSSCVLGPNILLSIQFSNTLSIRSSLNNSDQVSHPVYGIHTTENTFLRNLKICAFCKVPQRSLSSVRPLQRIEQPA